MLLQLANDYFMVRNNVYLPITRVYEERDLGVLFTSNLKFGSHISQIVHKANRLIGLIRQTFSYLGPPMLCVLYVGFVCPHLDYTCVIWNP